MSEVDLSARQYAGFSQLPSSLGDTAGVAPVASHTPVASVQVEDTAVDPTTAAEVAAQEKVSQQDRSGWTAFTSGWKQHSLAGQFMEFLDKPAFPTDFKYTAEQKAQTLYDANIRIDEGREIVAARSRSPEELAYHLQRWHEEDATMAAQAEHPAIMMSGAMLDADLLLAVGSGGASLILKGAGMTSRVLGMGRLASGLERASAVAARASEISMGVVSESRLKNAMVGAAYGTAWTAGIDALGDHPKKLGDYFTNAVAFGIGGSIFRRSPTNPIIHEPEPALMNATLDVSQAQQVFSRAAVAGTAELTAEEIAKMSTADLVEYNLKRTINRWQKDTAQDIPGLTAERLAGYKAAGLTVTLDHVQTARLGAEGVAALHSRAAEVAGMFKKLYPESALVVGLEEKAGTNGAMAWLRKDLAYISLSEDVARNTGKFPDTVIHELGHAIVIRELGTAFEKGDAALIQMFRESYTKEVERKATEGAAGVLDMQDVLARARPDGTPLNTSVMGLGTKAKSLEYFRNFDEWSAQQFVKTVYDVVQEAKTVTGAGIRDSALYKALPEGVRGVIGRVVNQFQKLYQMLVKSKALAADTDMKQFFNKVFERTPESVNPRNLEHTAADLPERAPARPVPPAPEPSAGAVPEDMPYIPYGPTSLNSVNDVRVLGWSEKVLGQGWFSVFDNLNSRGGYLSGLAKMLVVDGAGSTAQSAAAFKRVAELELGAARAGFDNAMSAATGMSKWQQIFRRSEYAQKLADLERRTYADLMDKYRAFGRGEELPINPDPQIELLSKAYADSQFAAKSLKYQKLAGRYGAELLDDNPYYVPMRTSADAVREATRIGRASHEDFVSLLTAQVRAMFPDMSTAQSEAMGRNLFEGIMERGRGVNSKLRHFEGTTVDELRQALENAKFSAEEIDGFLTRYQQRAVERSKDKSLRHRLDWDMGIRVPTLAGGELGMQDLLEKNLLHTLEGHTRTVSGQYGLGMVGFKSDASLSNAIDTALRDYQSRGATGADLQYTQELVDNVVHSLVGRRVGEAVPELFRGLSSLSSSVILKNPAVYMAGEASRIAHEFGAGRLIKSLFSGGILDGMKLMDHESLKSLDGILANRYVAEGRWKPLVTHMEDNFSLASPAAEWMLATGQATRFANGMEFVRRKLCSTLSSMIVADMYSAARGTLKDTTHLARYGFDEPLLGSIRSELERHGEQPLLWDAKVLARTETAAMNMIDQLVQANRLGELPAFMAFTQTGKIIMPYMNFVGGAFNKVLRKGLADHTHAGVAMMMLYQIAGGALGEAGRNILAGRAPQDSGTQNFTLRAISVAPVSSWFGYGLDTLQSVGTGSLAQFAFPNAVKNAVLHPSAKNLMAPVIVGNVVPGVGILTSAIDDSND